MEHKSWAQGVRVSDAPLRVLRSLSPAIRPSCCPIEKLARRADPLTAAQVDQLAHQLAALFPVA